MATLDYSSLLLGFLASLGREWRLSGIETRGKVKLSLRPYEKFSEYLRAFPTNWAYTSMSISALFFSRSLGFNSASQFLLQVAYKSQTLYIPLSNPTIAYNKSYSTHLNLEPVVTNTTVISCQFRRYLGL